MTSILMPSRARKHLTPEVRQIIRQVVKAAVDSRSDTIVEVYLAGMWHARNAGPVR